MDFAKNLKVARLARKLTRKDAAARYGEIFNESLHPQTLVKLESGRMRVTGDWLGRLAQVYDVTPEALAVGNASDALIGTQRVPVRPAASLLVNASPVSDDFVMVSDHDIPRVADADLAAVSMGDRVVVLDQNQTEPEPRAKYAIARAGVVECRTYRTNPERWESPGADVFSPAGEAIQVFGRVVLTILREQTWRA